MSKRELIFDDEPKWNRDKYLMAFVEKVPGFSEKLDVKVTLYFGEKMYPGEVKITDTRTIQFDQSRFDAFVASLKGYTTTYE